MHEYEIERNVTNHFFRQLGIIFKLFSFTPLTSVEHEYKLNYSLSHWWFFAPIQLLWSWTAWKWQIFRAHATWSWEKRLPKGCPGIFFLNEQLSLCLTGAEVQVLYVIVSVRHISWVFEWWWIRYAVVHHEAAACLDCYGWSFILLEIPRLL